MRKKYFKIAIITILHEAMENALESNGKKFTEPPRGYKNKREK